MQRAQHLLDLLARAHLVQPVNPGRYGMHDLLRTYATYLTGIEDCEKERWTPLTRLFDHYLATAGAAMDTLVPAEQHRRPRIRPPATPSPPGADTAAARVWLDTERITLTTVSAYTSARGWPGHTTGLATILFRYLEVGGHYPEAVAIHTHALHAARKAGDSAGEAHALTRLGVVYWRQGRYGKAAEHHQQALTLCRQIGHRGGEAEALNGIGGALHTTGQLREACIRHTTALTLASQIGDPYEQARAHDGLGHIHHATGDYGHARHHWRETLALYTDLGVPEADDIPAHLTALDQATDGDTEE